MCGAFSTRVFALFKKGNETSHLPPPLPPPPRPPPPLPPPLPSTNTAVKRTAPKMTKSTEFLIPMF